MRLGTSIPLLVIVLVLSLSTTPEMVSAIYDYEKNPIADTYISTAEVNCNRATSNELNVRWDQSNNWGFRTLLKFDLSSIPAGSKITEAKLILQASSSSGPGPRTFTVYRISKSWTEGDGGSTCGTTGATWINADKSGPTPWSTQGGDFVLDGASSIDITPSLGAKVWDVKDIVQAWINGEANYGFLIKVLNEEGDSVSLTFLSKDFGSSMPILRINWEWDYKENPLADTFLIDSIPDGNSGGDNNLIAGWASMGGPPVTTRVLLKFDLSTIPAGVTINEAHLSLTVNGYGGTPPWTETFTVYRVTRNWVEGTTVFPGPGTTGATWNQPDKSTSETWNSPGTGTPGDYTVDGASSLTFSNGVGVRDWDVTAIVKAWIEDNQANHGFVIIYSRESQSEASVYFTSRNFASRPADWPVLRIDWKAPPEPENSAPVGGLSLPTNVLRILTPYIALAGLIIAVSTAFVMRRRKN
ncbi:DNRLRE domain-containing protein [[Eubacterium] cellulosolvens]